MVAAAVVGGWVEGLKQGFVWDTLLDLHAGSSKFSTKAS